MKRSDNIAWAQLRVGIFIIVALVFLAIGIVLMGRQTKLFSEKGSLTVIMSDVAGLKVGAPVWLAGLDVGVVTSLRFEQPKTSNNVEVLLQVEKESLAKIGPDSAITVKTRGLMGEKYVDITPSDRVWDKPPDRLTGTAPVRIDDVMQKAGASFDTLNRIIAQVGKGEGSMGRFIKDPTLYDNTVRLTRQLDFFVTNVNSGQGTLGRLANSSEPYDRLISILERADSTLEEIQHSQGTMSRLIHDPELYQRLVRLTEKGEKAADDVRGLTAKLNSRESTIGMLLTDRDFYDKGMGLMQRTENSLQSLEEMLAQMRGGRGTLGRLIGDDELYRRLNQAVEDVDLLVKDVKEHPKRYLKISIF